MAQHRRLRSAKGSRCRVKKQQGEGLPGFDNGGTHQARFDADHLASGVYFYQLTADCFSRTRTMVLLR